MSLDSKSKRGSAMLLTLPYRPWLTEPDGTLAAGDRLSLVKLCSSIAAAELVVGPWRAVAGQVYCPGAVAGEVYVPGHAAGEVQA